MKRSRWVTWRPLQSFTLLSYGLLFPLASFTAVSAQAGVIYTLSSEVPSDTNTNDHKGTIKAVSGDLIETVGSVASESGNGDPSRHVTASMFNGKISTGVVNGTNNGDINSPTAAGYYGTGHFIEFALDTSTNIGDTTSRSFRLSSVATAFAPASMSRSRSGRSAAAIPA